MQSYYPRETRQTKAPLPSWVNQQRYAYPHHVKHLELINSYSSTLESHQKYQHYLQLAVSARLKINPSNVEPSFDEKNYADRLIEAKEELDQAEQELLAFSNHLPEERIALHQSGIDRLLPLLEQAKAAEHEYTTQLLNDPSAAKKRLERMVHGYQGLEAEFGSEHLEQLRSLRTAVELIEREIKNHKNDIETIHLLVAQAEQRAKIQAKMDVVLPEFSRACADFSKAWAELEIICDEHQIEFYDELPKIPSSASFSQKVNLNDNPSTLILKWG